MIAVLSDGLLLRSDRTETILKQTWDINGQWSISRLLNLARKFQIEQVWIPPGGAFWQKIKGANDTGNYPQFWRPGTWTVKPAKLKAELGGNDSNYLTGWDDSGFRVQLHFPGVNGVNWPFDGLSDPYVLMNALIEFRDRLGVRPSFAHRSAFELLRLYSKKPEFVPEDPGSYWEPFKDAAQEWIRLYKPKVRAGLFAHAFDKRSMFLTAARSALVGTGPYDEIGKCKLEDLKGCAGLVEIKKLKFKDPILKDLFDGETRLMLPMVEFLKDHTAGPIEITQGWIWRKPVRYFERFAKKLGDVIKETRDHELPELQAVNAAAKLIYVRLIGWFNRGNAPRGPGDWNADLYRPDWRASIIATANANLLRNIYEVRSKRGLWPFGIYHDCLMYLSDFEDPEMQFAGTRLLENNVFSHEWVMSADLAFETMAEGVGRVDAVGKEQSENKKNTIAAGAAYA